MILEEISVRAEKNKFSGKELACIESIMLKLVNHFTKLENLLALVSSLHLFLLVGDIDNFIPILWTFILKASVINLAWLY